MKAHNCDTEKLTAFYDSDGKFGALYNDIAESQYGIKSGKVRDPSRYHFFHEILLALIRQEIARDAVLLDIGCGAGILAKAVRGKVKKYVGIDISRERVRQAEEEMRGGGCIFEVQDAQHLAFGDGSFDTAVAIEVIEHIPDTDLFLKEANRVLAKDGTLIISTPTNLIFKDMTGCLYKDQHVYEFNLPRLRSVLARNGFSIKTVTGIGFKSPRIVIPVWLGSDIIKYLYKAIMHVDLRAGYGHPISLEFNIVSNHLVNKMYFLPRWKSLSLALMDFFGFLGSHFPLFSSNVVIICQK